MTDKPLTVKEAADFLGVSAYTIAEYLRAGKLKGYKLGNGTGKRESRRQWRIWKADLLNFINRFPNINGGAIGETGDNGRSGDRT